MNFEANRSRYRIINKLCYFLSAIRILCSRSERMADTFEDMKQLKSSKTNVTEYYSKSLANDQYNSMSKSHEIDIEESLQQNLL